MPQIDAMTLAPWDVYFLGPTYNTVLRYIDAMEDQWGLAKIKDKAMRPRELLKAVENNETSRVIALHHTGTGETVFLPGDATKKSTNESLIEFSSLQKNLPKNTGAHFRCVKASHHGAWVECHSHDLYETSCKGGVTEVVITCGDSDADHPHPDTLSHIHSLSISAFSTAIPHSSVATAKSRRSGWPPMGTKVLATESKDVILRIIDGKSRIKGGYKITPLRKIKKAGRKVS